MSVYFITGKLGAGKGISAVGRISEYVKQGRRIATNLDIYPEHFRNKNNKKMDIIRVPDQPNAEDLLSIGLGYEGEKGHEDRFGLLVLDECGTWFNSRNWNDPERKALIDWFIHARKYRWDIIFMVQDISLIDKQARDALCEFTGYGSRLDKIQIPVISAFTRLIFDTKVYLPKYFRMKIYYGTSETSLKAETWSTRGTDIFDLYDTEQVFSMPSDLQHRPAVYSLLTPWHLVGRYQNKFNWKQQFSKVVKFVLFYSVIEPYQLLTGKQITV